MQINRYANEDGALLKTGVSEQQGMFNNTRTDKEIAFSIAFY